MKKSSNFFLSLGFQGVLPLIPLAIEAWRGQEGQPSFPSDRSILLSTVMYSVAVANASFHGGLFTVFMLVGLVFSMCFGAHVGGAPFAGSVTAAVSVLCLAFCSSTANAYYWHINQKKGFFRF